VIDTMSEDDWAKARKINEEVRTNGLKHLDYTLHATVPLPTNSTRCPLIQPIIAHYPQPFPRLASLTEHNIEGKGVGGPFGRQGSGGRNRSQGRRPVKPSMFPNVVAKSICKY
jgi:hypothetical protein